MSLPYISRAGPISICPELQAPKLGPFGGFWERHTQISPHSTAPQPPCLGTGNLKAPVPCCQLSSCTLLTLGYFKPTGPKIGSPVPPKSVSCCWILLYHYLLSQQNKSSAILHPGSSLTPPPSILARLTLLQPHTLFLEHPKHLPTSGPLPLPFPLPGIPFSQISMIVSDSLFSLGL